VLPFIFLFIWNFSGHYFQSMSVGEWKCFSRIKMSLFMLGIFSLSPRHHNLYAYNLDSSGC
jgi:hypothetical protein